MTEPESELSDPWLKDREHGTKFEMRSLVSHRTFDPLVQIAIDDRFAHFTPKECIAQALFLIECAEAAMSDAFIFRLATEELKLTETQAAYLVQKFRDYRSVVDERQEPSGDFGG